MLRRDYADERYRGFGQREMAKKEGGPGQRVAEADARSVQSVWTS